MPRSLQVYDLKHLSMECYKVVAVWRRKAVTRSIVASSPCASCITWYDVTACRGHILRLRDLGKITPFDQVCTIQATVTLQAEFPEVCPCVG
jgi:hypothetical protein